ncbi:MAG: XTP/dITP diphosphatase [Lachnospiraceae bacterium]|nr:XTP/dITP diphosphatase [Lachnospiraceae bacterium]
MKKIIFATGNQDKLREIREILADTGIEVESMKEAGIDVEIIEDGSTFAENAAIKARAVCKASGEIAIADDSGLVVDAMNGEPGIYSARWMGEETSYRVKNAEILKRLEGVPDEKRSARFVCAMVCVFPDGREIVCEDTFEGRIGYREAGENGFGYDPIFFVPEKNRYSAELPREEKNAISHRGKALRRMRAELEKVQI